MSCRICKHEEKIHTFSVTLIFRVTSATDWWTVTVWTEDASRAMLTVVDMLVGWCMRSNFPRWYTSVLRLTLEISYQQ